MNPTVRVAAAVLFDAARRVLIAQRPEGKYLGGFWEFPGGKLDADETTEQALARELREELGIETRGCHRLLQLRHHYPDREVVLDVFVVEDFAGVPAALEGQPLQWVAPTALAQQRLLPADLPIVDAILAYEGHGHGAGHRTAGHSAR